MAVKKKSTKKAFKKSKKSDIPKEEPTKPKMGRPKKVVDWATVEKLAGIFCIKAEICAVIDVSESTLERACKTEYLQTFDELYKKWSLTGCTSLRRFQFLSAQRGHVTMQIWLGKQYLGQKDIIPEDIDNRGEILDGIQDMINRAKKSKE